MSYRVVHYINQFFANIGGEEMAHVAPELREGFVGPGLAFNQAWKGEAEIVATIVCGDSHFAEHEKEAKAQILAWVKEKKPDLFIAGPAFNAGRYGYACANVALAVKEELGIRMENIKHELLAYVNSKVNRFSKISTVIEQKDEFEKTPTHKIKRFLYNKKQK